MFTTVNGNEVDDILGLPKIGLRCKDGGVNGTAIAYNVEQLRMPWDSSNSGLRIEIANLSLNNLYENSSEVLGLNNGYLSDIYVS